MLQRLLPGAGALYDWRWWAPRVAHLPAGSDPAQWLRAGAGYAVVVCAVVLMRSPHGRICAPGAWWAIAAAGAAALF